MNRVTQALRKGTRAEHEAVEAALDWEGRASNLGRYRQWIERLYGFHRSWEPAIAVALDDNAFVEPRRRLHLLESDLGRLGVPPAAREGIARPPAFKFVSAAEALGSMYVVEGSTLGGQVIARHVASTLGFCPAYHGGHAKGAAAMWHAFQRRLTEVIEPEQDAEVVASAVATFRGLRDWLTRPCIASTAQPDCEARA